MTDCITNDDLWSKVPGADRPRPCKRRGMTREGVRIPEAHWASCQDDECRGCVPRSATHGHLCVVCWTKAEDALARVGDLTMHLRSIEKPPQAIGERVATSMEKSILMPDTWIAADGLLEALGARHVRAALDIREDHDELAVHVRNAVAAWSDLGRIVSTVGGAKRAVVLVRRMQTALRRWPDAEVQWRHIPHMLCPRGGVECGKSLYRRAPLAYGDEILVECVVEGCGYAMDYFAWVEQYERALLGAFKGQDKADGTKRSRGFRLSKKPDRPNSDECDAGNHDACRSLECACDCHIRTTTLWSPPKAYRPEHRVARPRPAATIAPARVTGVICPTCFVPVGPTGECGFCGERVT